MESNNLKITPATPEQLIATAAYYRQCARDEWEGVTSQDRITVNYGTSLARQYMAKVMIYEDLLEKDMSLRVERLKEIHTVSTQGKTKDLFTNEQMAGKTIVGPAIPLNQITKTLAIEKEKEPKVKLSNKTIDSEKKSYVMLAEVPLTEEQKDEISSKWKNTKGDKAKTELYEKVRDLMNYYDLSVSDLRGEIGSFVHHHNLKIGYENKKDILKKITESGITLGLEKINLDKLIKGKELLDGKMPYAIDDQFNLLLLTGYTSMEDVPPADYAKLSAIYLRITGRETSAIKDLKDFFSTKDWIWDDETAFTFLNAITKTIKHNPIKALVKNILVHKSITGDVLKGISNVTKLLHAYSLHEISIPIITNKVIKDDKGTETIKKITTHEKRSRFWGEGKISNVINECLEELYKSNTLTKPKAKPKQTAKVVNKKTTEEAPKVVNTKIVAKVKEPAKKVVTKEVKENKPKATIPSNKDKNKSDNKVFTTNKTANRTAQQNAKVTPPAKKDDKTVPIADLKGKKDKKPQTEKDELKAAKIANKIAVKAETENSKTVMTVIKTAGSDTPSNSDKVAKITNNKFQAIIYKKNGQYGCYIKGYQDEVHVKNINDIKKVKATYARALQEYIKKAEKVNLKAKSSEQNVKGKLFKMLPVDLTMKNIQFHDVGELKDAI